VQVCNKMNSDCEELQLRVISDELVYSNRHNTMINEWPQMTDITMSEIGLTKTQTLNDALSSTKTLTIDGLNRSQSK
jgi:hypothetical protein